MDIGTMSSLRLPGRSCGDFFKEGRRLKKWLKGNLPGSIYDYWKIILSRDPFYAGFFLPQMYWKYLDDKKKER